MAPHVLAGVCPLCPRSACNHLVLALYVVCVCVLCSPNFSDQFCCFVAGALVAQAGLSFTM